MLVYMQLGPNLLFSLFGLDVRDLVLFIFLFLIDSVYCIQLIAHEVQFGNVLKNQINIL